MKKKIVVVALFIAMLGVAVLPINVNAAMKEVNSTNSKEYGTITVMESDGWETKPDGGKYITQTISVTKVNGAGYVYIRLNEDYNVAINQTVAGDSFEKVSETKEVGGISYVFKLKSGTSISSKTELLTVVADIKDPTDTKCTLSFSPLSMSCVVIDNKYYDSNGNEITEEQYAEICEGVKTEEKNEVEAPATGSYVPFIAVGGGLIAIVGVYIYSKKSNKMYKL